MSPAARHRRRVRGPMLASSAAAWALLLFDPGGVFHHQHHLPLTDPTLAAGWLVMVVAMMWPMVIAPVRHVRDRSFARRRRRATGLFLSAYTAAWLGAMFVLLPLARIIMATPAPLWIGILLAGFWQCSAWKQRCLNEGHVHPELAAFGGAADRAVLHFGWTHGLWCAGSCWALMLLPVLFHNGHLPVMVAVSLWLYGEKLDNPSRPAWTLRFPAKAIGIVVAQLRLKMRAAL